jgi:hypothetical protein
MHLSFALGNANSSPSAMPAGTWEPGRAAIQCRRARRTEHRHDGPGSRGLRELEAMPSFGMYTEVLFGDHVRIADDPERSGRTATA